MPFDLFKDFSLLGVNYEKGLTGEKKNWRSIHFWGSVGPPPINCCVFELHRLDFLQIQQDFRSFSDR